MKFAKLVFLIAGIWGVLVMTSMYFLLDVIGRQYPPPITHPDLYYGFVSITFAWQVVFLVISTDPIRYRPVMAAALVEKFGYIATLGVLYARGQIQFGQFAVIAPDCVLGLLFIAAFLKTKGSNRHARAQTILRELQPTPASRFSCSAHLYLRVHVLCALRGDGSWQRVSKLWWWIYSPTDTSIQKLARGQLSRKRPCEHQSPSQAG